MGYMRDSRQPVTTWAEKATVGLRYQTTASEGYRLWRLSMLCSELWSVWISDSAVVSFSYNM
jgi:hypothetical protein